MLGIYRLTHIPSKRVYIGSSSNVGRRIKAHLTILSKNQHDNKYLQFCWNKYGAGAFEATVIEEVVSQDQLIKREQFYMDFYNSYDRGYGFNINPVAGRTSGVVRDDNWRLRQSLSHKGRSREQSDEERFHRTQLMKGNTFWVGRKHKPETIEKMRLSYRQRVSQ